MAVDKLVDSAQLDADLATVADAIRAKGGTSAQLSFPDGMAQAIDAIPTGGGGSTSAFGEMTMASDIQQINISFALDSSPVIYGFSTNTNAGEESFHHVVASVEYPFPIHRGYYVGQSYGIGFEGTSYIKNVSKDGMTLDATLCGAVYFFGAGHTLKWWAMCE